MKTAISVPDETFERACRRASDLGMSRSEFFARAAQHYLDALDRQSLTGQIDSALERLGGTDEAAAAAVAVGTACWTRTTSGDQPRRDLLGRPRPAGR